MKKIIIWQLPVKTASEGNCSEHWVVKWRRNKEQKKRIALQFKIEKPKISLPCKITLTRIAPRALDIDENLPMAFKWVKDAIADRLIPGLAPGRADDSKELTWKYSQEKGKPREYAVRIEIEYEEDFTKTL